MRSNNNKSKYMENRIITRLKEAKGSLQDERDEWIRKQDEQYVQMVKSFAESNEKAKDLVKGAYKIIIDSIEEMINDYTAGKKIIERIEQCQQNLKTQREELIRYIETPDFDMSLGLLIDKEQLKERINKNYKSISDRLNSLYNDIVGN